MTERVHIAPAKPDDERFITAINEEISLDTHEVHVIRDGGLYGGYLAVRRSGETDEYQALAKERYQQLEVLQKLLASAGVEVPTLEPPTHIQVAS
jgi:hypothetical protein